MTLVKFRPNRARTWNYGLNNWMDDFISRDISNFLGNDSVNHVPSVNVVEHDKGFRIDVSAPGFDKKDFQLNVDKNVLNIRGEVQEAEEKKAEKFTRREFKTATFSRSFTLPEDVNADKIKANYTSGILHIEIPRKAESKKDSVKQITIS